MSRDNLFTIGEFSKVTGISIHSLRYYDEIGALKPEYVDPVSNYRYYSFAQLGLVPAINICRDTGINLGEFESFIVDNEVDYKRLLREGKKSLDRRIEESLNKQHTLIQLMERLNIAEALSRTSEIIFELDSFQALTIPYDKSSIDNESKILLKLSSEASKKGLSMDPFCYGLFCRTDGDGVVYAFSLLRSTGGNTSSAVKSVQAGSYLIRRCENCSIEAAKDIFRSTPGYTPEGPLFSVCLMQGQEKKPFHFAAVRVRKDSCQSAV